jgi:phage-related protein
LTESKRQTGPPGEHEYLAYNGPKKRIEFYYTVAGKVIGTEFLKALPVGEKAKLAAVFAVMGDRGAIRNEEKFKHLKDKIYEFKAHPNRVLCFFVKGDLIVLTHGFVKKERKTPGKEIEKAFSIREDYLDRVKRGCYYEK